MEGLTDALETCLKVVYLLTSKQNKVNVWVRVTECIVQGSRSEAHTRGRKCRIRGACSEYVFTREWARNVMPQCFCVKH
jgi:hypothetical protein